MRLLIWVIINFLHPAVVFDHECLWSLEKLSNSLKYSAADRDAATRRLAEAESSHYFWESWYFSKIHIIIFKPPELSD